MSMAKDEDYIDIDDTGPEGLKGADGGYAWEEEYKRSWDVIQEDAQGSIQSSIQVLYQQNRRHRRVARDTDVIQRGIIRHVVLIIDQSDQMQIRDLLPSRIQATLNVLGAFIGEFFDQNPLSQICLVATKDGLAEKLTDLSGNPMDHLAALKEKTNKDLAGEPSLQNALELAMHTLRGAPGHGSREIICCWGSLTTCDPGDIEQTLESLRHLETRVSMVHLAAEVHIFKKICQRTQGDFTVANDTEDLKDALFLNIRPPPLVSSKALGELVRMGFPQKLQTGVPIPCVCHQALSFKGYRCPQCQNKVCGLPTECDCCGLMLVSAPHLARSYHHLFPEKNFLATSRKAAVCFGCGREAAESWGCPQCQRGFCWECDGFVHEVLHNCPGCC